MNMQIPTMLPCGEIRGSLNDQTRSVGKISEKGRRTTRLVDPPKLQEISKTTGENFFKAWIEIMTRKYYVLAQSLYQVIEPCST